jgi:hypothetical protein
MYHMYVVGNGVVMQVNAAGCSRERIYEMGRNVTPGGAYINHSSKEATQTYNNDAAHLGNKLLYLNRKVQFLKKLLEIKQNQNMF